MSGLVQRDSRPVCGGSAPPNSGPKTRMQPYTIASESIPIDPMDITSPSSASMGPPSNSSPELDQGTHTNGSLENHTAMHTGTAAAGMAVVPGPKVVQTAFIHKLYNMLEDRTIQHLISWSNTNESFLMSPSNEFSKVLAQYFKHTNISSFVRQLNMYGFHKVGDVFHGSSPDSALWEFRHGNGNFKKGDVMGLREIKRRASRHALIHRDSFSGHKTLPPQPSTPTEPMPDTLEQRVANMEHAFHRMHQRVSRTDDNLAMLISKYQALMDGLVHSHQWSHSLSSHVQSLASTESALYVEVSNMQKEIARQLEVVRSLDTSHDALLAGRQPYFQSMSLDPHPPLSPRYAPFDESRRSSFQIPEPPPPVPIQHGYVGRSLNPPISSRTYGIRNSSNHNASPPDSQFNRPPVPSHRLSITSTITGEESPNLARRHTSADIRQHGWPPNAPPIPPMPQNFETNNINPSSHVSGNNSTAPWPSSPNRTPTNANPTPNPFTAEHQHLRDHLATYEFNPSSSSSRKQIILQIRHPTPPPPPPHPPSSMAPDPVPPTERVGWSLGAGGIQGPKFPRLGPDLHSAPVTRRSSMASNVHSLLNPAETAERDNEDETGADDGGGAGDERKRKRGS